MPFCVCRHALSKCLSLCEIPHLASLYVPLDAGGLLSTNSSFQTAALLAAAVDTVTLPFRCTGVRLPRGAAGCLQHWTRMGMWHPVVCLLLNEAC